MSDIKSKDFAKGHRRRLRERINKAGCKSLSNHELIEFLLFYTIYRRDTKAIAKDLLKRFGSLNAVVYADKSEIMSAAGIGEITADYFSLLAELFSRICLPLEDGNVNVFSDWVAVLRYCQLTMGSKNREALRVLFLNKKNILIADEFFDVGTVDKIAIYPREVARYALIHGALAILLVHNHPSGDPSPSKEDIIMTNKIIDTLKPINILVHDHLIVSKNSHFSFRAAGIIS